MQPCVLFLTMNGAGLGHLTRSMAIARRLPPWVRPVFLTQSQALPVVVQEGFHAEYVMSASYVGAPTKAWGDMYGGRVQHVIDLYDPAVVVFDGTFAYAGLRGVIGRRRRPMWVWSRRAMWREGFDRALSHAELFDAVLEPGEVAAPADRGATVAQRDQVTLLDPVTLLDREQLASRDAARAELGLRPDATCVLVQLGAGNINDTASQTGMVVERLRAWDEVQIVVADSVISGAPVPLPDDVRRARVYPLSRLLAAFDATVTATGYNTFHEAIAFEVPAVWVPNEQTAVDDQVARAEYADRMGMGVAWRPETATVLDAAMASLRDPAARDGMRAAMRRHQRPNGAGTAAELLTAFVRLRREGVRA